MKFDLQVENIKCGGCAGTIKKKLLSDSRITTVEVDIEQGLVSIAATEGEGVESDFSAALLKMGYPESGTAEGLVAAKARAKSFVSCAMGKVDNMVNK